MLVGFLEYPRDFFMAGAAIAPALGVISAHFAGRNPLLIQLIVSLPALFIILTNLVFPWLCRLMKTRTLALTGLALYVLSGSGAFFVYNIWMLLEFRAMMGVSVGMIMPLSTGLLAYYFPTQTIILIDNQLVTAFVVQIWFRKKGVYLVTNRTMD